MTYDGLARPLVAGSSVLAAAELHGCVSGALCARDAVGPAEWAAEALPGHEDAGQVAALQAALDEVIFGTRAALAGDEMAFTPLLPSDAVALEERVAALAAWCNGFLYGIARSGWPEEPRGDVAEILGDLGEIARAGCDEEEAGEEAEREYAELVEFVRAAVQLAYEELAPLRAAAARPAGGAVN